jgi:hypothetical protein
LKTRTGSPSPIDRDVRIVGMESQMGDPRASSPSVDEIVCSLAGEISARG